MRKTTKQAIAAFIANKDIRLSNTRVIVFDEKTVLTLFDNIIAERMPNGDTFIQTCGWFTNTTKERLNGLPNISICQREGIWYLNGKKWDGTKIKI